MKKILVFALACTTWSMVRAQDECSDWRWRVKTLTDDSGIDWDNVSPRHTTLSHLDYNSVMAFEPEEMEAKHANKARMGSEKEKVALTCYVYDVKTDYKDGDYHLFLADHKDGTGKHMDAKIPDPECRGLKHYAHLRNMYHDARKEADVIKSWTDAGYVVKVDLEGVPFRCFEYEARDNTYYAREIHPVTYLKAYLP